LSNTILEIKGLSKKYRKVKALDQLNLTVEKGMIFGILGPNGSGKTTTLGILLGVINASGGNFSWFGNGAKDVNRKRIGALLETPNFYPYLSAEKNLRIVARIKNLSNVEERIEKVLQSVNLFERKTSKFKTFSLGMKQRLAIASALLNDPEVLVLDEPTNGLDPQGIAEIRGLILEIAKEGKTIIIASHQLDEIEKVCTDVVILKFGVAIRQSAIQDIIGGARQIIVGTTDLPKIEALLPELVGVTFNNKKGKVIVLDAHGDISTEQINQYFFEKGIVLSELREIRKSLEDQFLEITK
jgi:ABC-type multidrug transport system ATPase subunit